MANNPKPERRKWKRDLRYYGTWRERKRRGRSGLWFISRDGIPDEMWYEKQYRLTGRSTTD